MIMPNISGFEPLKTCLVPHVTFKEGVISNAVMKAECHVAELLAGSSIMATTKRGQELIISVLHSIHVKPSEI